MRESSEESALPCQPAQKTQISGVIVTSIHPSGPHACYTSLRYYEEQGLLRPAHNTAGHRRYAAKDADCVSFIQRLWDR
ncbi:MerR family transcriptional regulator [Streptomyces antimycoticus]